MLFKKLLCALWLGCFGLVAMSQSVEPPQLVTPVESSTQVQAPKVKRTEIDPFADAQAILERERKFHLEQTKDAFAPAPSKTTTQKRESK